MKLLLNLLKPIIAINYVLLIMIIGFSGIARSDDVIGADDLLKIKINGYEDLTTDTRVSGDGRISFPFIGDIEVAGLTTFEAEHKIALLLKNGEFIKEPKVSIAVLEFKSQQVSVLGQVYKPGLYSLESQSTLLNVIAMAGGIRPEGDNHAIITHYLNGKPTKHEINLTNTLEHPENNLLPNIEKGDVIFIPKAPMFFIRGEVEKPGAYPLEQRLTVSHALSIGGGLTSRGTLRGIIIERRDQNGNIKEIDTELMDTVLKDDVIIFDERLF